MNVDKLTQLESSDQRGRRALQEMQDHNGWLGWLGYTRQPSPETSRSRV